MCVQDAPRKRHTPCAKRQLKNADERNVGPHRSGALEVDEQGQRRQQGERDAAGRNSGVLGDHARRAGGQSQRQQSCGTIKPRAPVQVTGVQPGQQPPRSPARAADRGRQQRLTGDGRTWNQRRAEIERPGEGRHAQISQLRCREDPYTQQVQHRVSRQADAGCAGLEDAPRARRH